MEGRSTYFELPLERDLYVPRTVTVEKPPLHVLITDAGTRIAYCLIYKICSGDVFGQDQDIILHLVNARGTTDHKAVVLELDFVGFHVFKESVVSSDPDVAYKDVDVAIILNTDEEMSGFGFKESIAGHIIRLRNITHLIAQYSKPDVKIILTGPSTVMQNLKMMAVSKFEPAIPAHNITSVVALDESIALAHLAAKLKTTTDKIKNLVIWGLCCPDVHNATVLAYPPGDLGALEMEEISVAAVLQNDDWLRNEFVDLIEKRVIENDLVTFGKSIALATALHLKALFQGTEKGSYLSMGVITPDDEPYLVTKGSPFSFPVTAGNGQWKIVQGLEMDVRTRISILKALDNLNCDRYLDMHKMINYILSYENSHDGELLHPTDKLGLTEVMDHVQEWQVRLYLTPLVERIETTNTQSLSRPRRRSIAWEDVTSNINARERRRSSLKFNTKDSSESCFSKVSTNTRISIMKVRCNDTPEKLNFH